MEVREHEGAPDARLAAAASRGDDEAFAVLYVRYAPRIGAYLTRLLDDEHLAQDLTHEVFVSALRRLRTSRPPIAFGPWLYRIARNASIDVHRRSQLVRQVSLDGSAEDGVVLPGEDGPETVAELRQWLDDLRDLLGSLSETHRSVLVLREFEGLSNSEIGKRLGVSRPAVEGLLFRARAKMRREYDDLVSGRRCETVQESLTRAAAGRRLPVREHDLAARHLRACLQCRRHAWEAGVAGLFDERDGRSALLPVPAVVAALLARLASRLHHLGRAADPSTALAVSWGRAAAAATVLAVAGGSIVPAVRDRAGDVLSPSSHAAPARVAAAPAQLRIARSPAAAPTGAPARAAARPGAPVLLASAPAPSAAAAPTTLASSGHGDRGEADAGAAAQPAGAAPSEQASPAPANQVAAIAAKIPGTARDTGRPVKSRLPRPAVAVSGAAEDAAAAAEDAAAAAEDAAGAAEDAAGGTLVEVAETASEVATEVLPPDPPEKPAPPPPADVTPAVPDAAGTVQDAAGQVTDALPSTPAAPPDPPAPAAVPVPTAPPVPAPPPVPKPADPREASTASTALRNGTTSALP